MKKDKVKVIDEVWTEDRVKSFLDIRPHDETDQDFNMLLRAYQSMRVSDFQLFVNFFKAENRDINAESPSGQSVLHLVSEHRHGTEYAAVLHSAGAS